MFFSLSFQIILCRKCKLAYAVTLEATVRLGTVHVLSFGSNWTPSNIQNFARKRNLDFGTDMYNCKSLTVPQLVAGKDVRISSNTAVVVFTRIYGSLLWIGGVTKSGYFRIAWNIKKCSSVSRTLSLHCMQRNSSSGSQAVLCLPVSLAKPCSLSLYFINMFVSFFILVRSFAGLYSLFRAKCYCVLLWDLLFDCQYW